MARKKTKKKMASRSQVSVTRGLSSDYTGKHFNLRETFDRLNQRFFKSRLRDYQIVWKRRRKLRPKEDIVFGDIQEEDKIIRIHPLLDRAFIPKWYFEYIIYHEMLHAVVPDIPLPCGRRKVHTPEFYEREKQFPYYRKASEWHEKNLNRFFR